MGNDPYYILYLLDESDSIVYLNSIVNCKALEDDPYLLKTRIMGITKSNKEKMEETLYNVIDEVSLYPLSIENLFKTSLESSESDVFDDFIKEAVVLLEKNKLDELKDKIKTALEILNSESKEGYILNLLEKLSEKYTQDKFLETARVAFEEFGVSLQEKTQEKQEITKEKEKQEQGQTIELTQKEKEIAIDILNTQLKILKESKTDPANTTERTKLLLDNILKNMGFDDIDIDSIDNLDELAQTIKDVIEKIGGTAIAEKPEKKPVEETTKMETKKGLEKPQEPIEKPKPQKPQPKKPDSSHIPKTVKIEQALIDELMDIVGEILVTKNALPYIAENLNKIPAEQSKRELMNKFEEINRLTDQLQDRVMGMRLLPLSYIFDRYSKLVREISKKLDKKIKYIEEGGETKLDKAMIEKLADPLIHIIRNSLDHGIEPPEERKEKGKPEEGILKVSAYSQGDKVFINIDDDGRGIDTEKLTMKALASGLISSETLDKMAEKEKFMLIFLPGLSTKDNVSELSGRGVGGDALKKVVDELGGKIDVDSKKDEYTKITLELPVSVALTNIFHIKMNGINYAVPMDYLVETVKIEKNKVKTANRKPFMHIRGELIPLIFENTLLGDNIQDKKEYNVIVIQGKDIKYGFVVDELVGQLDVVQKPLSGVLNNHPLISGTSLLGNGDVLFILDPIKLVIE